MPQEAKQSLVFLQAGSDAPKDQPFVVIVRSREELDRWLSDGSSTLQWIQLEGLLGDPEACSRAAQGADEIPLDVVVEDPGKQFADLYRLVDARAVRDIRVSMSTSLGFFKALRLAASLGLPVRLLPGQPSAAVLNEFHEALDFYLHDVSVEAPIEFFHSALAWLRGAPTGSLWQILEQDPLIYHREPGKGPPPGFFAFLLQRKAECATCPWQGFCEGYFKWPDPEYSCAGVKQLFSRLRAAADEIDADLEALAARPT